MPLQTDLSVSPYFDDFSENKDYYKILFRPGVAVQARELNQLQSILQKQIERFGDNIFKRGTIVDGVNFIYYPSYPYVKIVDIQKDGQLSNPSAYKGLFAKSVNTQIGVNAFIVNYEDGFESTDPDLKTLYLNYINAGANGSTNTFGSGETITIYSPQYPVFSVIPTAAGSGFSNSDSVVFTSALVVNVQSGSFAPNQTLVQPSTNATVQIYAVDTSALASSNQVILSIRPLVAQLTNSSVNSTAWAIQNSAIVEVTGTANAIVEGIIGSGASAFITTDSIQGKILDVTLVSQGSGYIVPPHATVRSANNNNINSLILDAKNYLANVQISSVPGAVGNGYAFGVTEGVIYQKGYFTRVEPQTIIVEKYSQQPNAIAVGFDTREFVIDSNIDTSLLDNVLGTENENAPGANRLQLKPELVLLTSEAAKANDDFFILTEWSEGLPFRQNRLGAYNKIADEMARRTSDESGDYVLNRFQVTTRSPSNTTYEGNSVSIVVDPGLAYIGGYRVETQTNYVVDIPKGNDIVSTNNARISLDYENYIRVREVGGLFQFNTGDLIKLYDAAKGYLSNSSLVAAGNTTPQGNLIGTARMRSLLHYDGTPGTNTAIYKMYLFDVNMSTGKNFRDTKSVYYDGTKKGIADLVLSLDGTIGAYVATIEGTQKDKLLFPSGVQSVLSLSNTATYTYRTIDSAVTVGNNTGTVVKDISSINGEYFPYGSVLSDSELKDLYFAPLSDSMKAYSSLTGNVSVNTTSAGVVGTDTTFLSDLQPGDWVYLTPNATHSSVKRVVSIANDTYLTLDSNNAWANATDTKVYNYFPVNVPIALGNRTAPGQYGHSANVDANGNILTIQLKYANGENMTVDANTTAAIAVDIEKRSIVPNTKTATRDVFVKLRIANNVAGTNGPWALGVPDAFRLKAVYVGNSSVSTSSPDSVDDFYIDHNQTANYNDISYLYKRPDSKIALTTDDYLLVKFDYGVSSGTNGIFTTTSYTGDGNAAAVAITDSLPLANLTTKYNSFEVPEVYTKQGEYFDLLNAFDFRPSVEKTATPSTSAASAPVNPATANATPFGDTANTSNDKKFPRPQSVLSAKIDHYAGRIDSVFVSKSGSVFTIKGNPATSNSEMLISATPDFAMRLNNIYVPPYPNIPVSSSATFAQVLNRKVANERLSNQRIKNRIIQPIATQREITIDQPVGYTMSDIGNLDRRIQDLEYYVSLSLLESDMKDRVIPSSIDPSLSRFKYGFFVDDFSTTKFSDLDNPAYAASIENDDVLPEREYFTTHYPGDPISCDYVDFLLVSQDNATGKPAVNCQPSTTIANNWVVRKQITTNRTISGKEEVDVVNLKLSTVSANVSMYCHFYSGADTLEIYQGNTLIKTSADAELVTEQDKTKMKSNAVPSGWFSGVSFKNFTFGNTFKGVKAARDTFKIAWTHNPSNGTDYTVKVTKYTSIWRYALEYPINSNTVTCNSAPTTDPVVYHGIMVVTPGSIKTNIFS